MKTPLTKQKLVWLPRLSLSLAIALSASALASTAGQPALSGPFNLSFTNSGVPVYDLTGSYQFEHRVSVAGGATANLSLGCVLAQDGAGRLRGTGETNIQIGSNFLTARYSINGRVTGGGGKTTRAVFSARWVAQDSGAGVGPTSISLQYNLEVTPGSLDGTARGRARLGRLGGGTIKSPVADVLLPAGMDGNWHVKMNLEPPGGSGSINLANGRTLQAHPAVSFSARSGLGRIKLSGAGAERGTTLSVSFDPAADVLKSVSGKVLGQTVTVKGAGGGIVSRNVSLAGSSFAGAQACLECHTPIQQTLNRTRHAQVGVECENCHGPAANHAANDYDPLSRPLVSTVVNSCARCHNDRGASWTISSEPPKSTPQDGILLGTLGELASGLPHSDPAYHALHVTNLCIGCHLQSFPFQNPAQATTSAHGNFPVDSYEVCADCHVSVENTSDLVVFVNMVVANQIRAVQASLDQWATNKAPAIIGTAKYGTRAWEYTTPGALSPGGPGPDATEQALIQASAPNIQKARFNLYLALYDGSFGVHNGPYTVELLRTALDWVNRELAP